MGCCGDTPQIPDYNAAAVQGVMADLETLPYRKQVESDALRGTGQFTGIGEADYQKAYATAMAQTMLDLQKKYGADYVKQRLAELEQSDPAGAKMRRDMFAGIQKDLESAKTANRPEAAQLESYIMGELQKGGTLDDQVANAIRNQTRGGQAKSGILLGNAPAMQEAEAMAAASEAQKAQRQQNAITFLTTGVSPEDVSYRRTQQGMSNLSTFMSGQSPVAQFSQLSGAGAGTVPFYSGPAGSTVNPNAGQQGMQFAGSVYDSNQALQQGQVNPWIAGLSTGASAVGAYSALGGGKPAPNAAENFYNRYWGTGG